MVSTRPLISKSSSPYNNPLVTVPKAPIGIIVTFMFHCLFNSLAKSKYNPCFYILSISLCGPPGQQSPQFCEFSILSLIIIRSGCLTEIWWSVCISKSQRSLCVSFSGTDSGLYIYHLFVSSNVNFLHDSRWINLPTKLCLVLNSFCANLLHSLIILLIVSSFSPHNRHLLFCCVLSILALI